MHRLSRCMSNAPEIVERLARALTPLVDRYDMERVRIAPELAFNAGCWAGTPVEIVTSLYRGAGFLHRLQLAAVRSPGDGMSALTAIAVPSPDLAAPIFGADLVAFRGKFALAALDLSGGELSDEDGARLALARRALLTVARTREVPEFAKNCFSEHAAIAGEQDAGLDVALPQAFEAYLSVFSHRLARSALRPWDVGQREQQRYFAAMRSNKRESKAMAKLFGQRWAERYFEQLFFADELLPAAA